MKFSEALSEYIRMVKAGPPSIGFHNHNSILIAKADAWNARSAELRGIMDDMVHGIINKEEN